MKAETKKYDSEKVLRTTSLTIGQPKNLGQTLDQLLDLLMDLVGGESSTVWLDGEENSDLVLATSRTQHLNGEGRDTRRISKSFGAAFSLDQYPQLAFVVNERRPLNIPDTNNWYSWRLWGDGISNSCSWLGVPIQFGYDLYGVLGVSSTGTAAFQVEDEQLLEGVAGQMAILLENAKLSVQMDDANRQVGKLTSKLEESKHILGKLEKEIHDGPVQVITTLKLGLSLIYDELAEESVRQRQRIEEFMSLTDEVMAHYHQHKQDIKKKI